MGSSLRGADLAQEVWEKINSIPEFREYWGPSDNHPKEAWDQSTYIFGLKNVAGETCGTAACFAGWACLLVDGPSALEDHFTEVDGKYYHVHDRARELLELDDNASCELFWSDNELEDIRKKLEFYYGREFVTRRTAS